MIKFKLQKSDYIENYDLSIISILNRHKLDILSNDIKLLISYFNKEYDWNDMFNFDDVQTRISKGHHLFILYYGHNPIGYVFYEPKENNEFYLYNLYVTNQIKRPSYSAIWFVNNSIKLLPNTFSTITCVCEDWHTAAHNTFEKNGFIKYENS